MIGLLHCFGSFIRIPNARCLVADDGLLSIGVNVSFSDEGRTWRKIGKFLKVTDQKKLIKEFANKGWGLWGLNKLLKMLRETCTTAR